MCKIWWFSFCSLQSYTLTSLFHHSQAFRGQTYSWIFVCTWGVFFTKLGSKKDWEKAQEGNIAYFFQLMVSLKQPFSTSFKHVTQLSLKNRGDFFPTQMWQKASLDSRWREKSVTRQRVRNNFSWALERICLRSWVAFKCICFTSKHGLSEEISSKLVWRN